MQKTKNNKRINFKEKGITLVALVVTIIVLLILAVITVNSVVGQGGLLQRAKSSGNIYKKAEANESDEIDEFGKLVQNATNESEESSSSTPEKIEYVDNNNNTQILTKDTLLGTKIETTKIEDQNININWYLFDISDDKKTAYLISTPTYWVPDTTKEVNGAWVPKLVSEGNTKTGGMNQAIQKKENATDGSYKYSYNLKSVTYTPSEKTLDYYKKINSQWAAKRGKIEFYFLNENEQATCYLADEEIFEGLKNQLNSVEGNLKGKIQTLVGAASIEQWCKAYNKQDAAKNSKITCEYSEIKKPGYVYRVNGSKSTISNSDYYTGDGAILGNDIYGAAHSNKNTTGEFSSNWWWLASPSAYATYDVCNIGGPCSCVRNYRSSSHFRMLSLLASVKL